MTADMLAACLARETFPAAAAEVLGFSERIRMSVERVISPDEERLRGEVAEALRAALGDEILRACIARGRALAPRDLLAVAANPGFPLVS
jgi:hypothetical protein